MKKGLALLLTATALWACSPQQGGNRSETTSAATNAEQSAGAAATNEAAGAAGATNAPSTNAPSETNTNTNK